MMWFNKKGFFESLLISLKNMYTYSITLQCEVFYTETISNGIKAAFVEEVE